MKSLLENLLTPPAFIDEQQSSMARQLHSILMATAILSVVFGLPFVFAPPLMKWRYLLIACIITPTCLGLTQLSRQGHPRAAGRILIILLWTVATAGAFTGGGIHAPIFIGYLVVILISGILFGSWAAVSTACFSLLGGGVMVWAETTGFLPSPQVAYTPFSILVIYSFFFLSVLALERTASKELNRALHSAGVELTERRRAEAARQESEERFRHIFNLVPYGIAITNQEEILLEINEEFASLVGAPPHQIRGQQISEAGLTADSTLLAQLKASLSQANGLLNNVELTIQDNHSNPRHLMFSARRLEFQGKFHNLMICVDITAQKQAEQEQKNRAEEMSILYQVGQALTAGEDLYHALRAMVKELKKLMIVDAFYVGIYDEQTDIISFPLYLNLEDDLQVPPRNLAERPGLTASVIQKRQTLYIPDVTVPEIQRAYNIVIIVDMDVHSYIGIPLINQGRITGIMSVQACKPFAYTGEQVRMLETLAAQVAITVEKINLLEQLKKELEERKLAALALKKRADELSLLYKAGLILASITSQEDIRSGLLALADELQGLVRLDTLFIGLYDKNTDLITFPFFLVDGKLTSVPPRKLSEQPGLAGEVILSGQKLYLTDLTNPQINLQHPYVAVGPMTVRSVLVIPLIVHEEIVGVISVQNREANAYSPEEIRLLETLAAQVAIAIENERLFTGIQQELAERKQTETALRESEARLKAIINQFPYDLWVCDAEGRYLINNIVSEKAFPGSIGKTPAEIESVPIEIRQRWEAENQRALRGETVHSGPHDEIINGEQRSFITTIAPIVADGHIIGITGLSIDVTELRRAEAEVRHLNDELEKRVAERTTELEQANRELEAFSYSVSHDLRAPLRSIRSFGQILLNDFRDQLDAEGQNFLNKIIRSADELNELIDSLLTLFRFSRGEMHRALVNLSAEAESILEKLRHAEPDRAVTYLVDQGLIASVDASLLRNVLENLLGNAWKYSSQNPAARIEFGTQLLNGETVYFVRDNGAGFDPRYAGQLFKPFQRLHRADEFPGHGIGLATVQRIIQRHGGRIWAESAVGQGATFYFTLG